MPPCAGPMPIVPICWRRCGVRMRRHRCTTKPCGPCGLAAPADYLERDWTQAYAASPEVKQAWLTVYRQSEQYGDLYQLGEKLTEIGRASCRERVCQYV